MRPAILALLLASGLAAQSPVRQPVPEVGEGRRQLAEALDLSPEQRQQLRSLAQKHRGEFRAARQAMQARQQALRQALADPATSQAQLRQLYEGVSEQRFQNLLALRAARQEFQAVLTPEQRERLQQLRAQRRGQREG